MTPGADLRTDFFFSLRYPLARMSLWFLTMSLLMLALVGIFYWWPAMSSIAKLQDSLESKRREIHNLDYSARLGEVTEHAADRIVNIERQLEASATQASLVRNMASLAKKYNVRILSEAYEEGQPKDGYYPLVHALTLQGGYRELRAFISDLRDLPSFTVVQEAVIGRTNESALLRAQLNLVTYRKTGGPARE